MTQLTPAQIAGAARDAGWSPLLVPFITAIALAESGGNTHAHNGTAPDNSYGLTQVNMIGGMGPARRKQFGLTSNDELFDPTTNMRAALKIYQDAGNSFSPWSTWLHGTYRQYLPAGQKAAGQAVTPPSAGQEPGAGSTAGGGATAVSVGFLGMPDWLSKLGGVAGDAVVGGLAGGIGGAGVAGGLSAGGLGGPVTGSGGSAVSGDPSLLAVAGSFLALWVRAAVWIGNPENWLRVAKVGSGVVLIGAGAAVIARPVVAPVTQPVVAGAKKVAKVAAVAA